MSRSALNHRVIVVTGASSGVGRAICRALGREGSRVALIARGTQGLSAAADEVRQGGGARHGAGWGYRPGDAVDAAT